MAEHLRHQQARAGFAVHPRSIQTLASVVDTWTQARAAPLPLMVCLVREAVAGLRLARFEGVADFRGFHVAVAQMLEELPAGGLAGDWGQVQSEVDDALDRRGMARRNVRLQAAARAIEGAAVPYSQVIFEGFFSFGPAELELAAALGRKTAVTVQEPEAHNNPRRTLLAAPSIEREAEEIARRILGQAARGRPFREMAIVLRVREPYAPVLETTLARFGIPARFYFSDPLASHPLAMFVTRTVRSMLAGWDREGLLSAVRMPVSGIGATPEGDRLDFEWRERIPDQGLPKQEGPLLARLAAFDALRQEKLPASEWATRLKAVLAAEALACSGAGARPALAHSLQWPEISS